MISARGIKKQFGDLQVLKGIDLDINSGEVVSIVGPSGAGKTTLLQILGTLDKPNAGDVIINNTSIRDLSEKELAQFRNENIGFVFQFHQLLPEFNAIENITLPALIAGKNKAKSEEKARYLLSFLQLNNRETHKPAELSGGEKQRVAIARALINNPAVVFADEPTGSLDSQNQEELHKLFFQLRDEFKQTFVIVTHDLHLAHLSDREIKMKDGFVL
ncbi:ABC transporter ATP-binding protein [Saccharicrinis fermentans]|uniref:Lipoprotein-releasing system ATP-binding protein LolD n=1 Tax=Saccharicrinis fermentans DSM 9555 = JCM 21142 TaxID=869213 RepID=W7YJ57_9BACT|nr:ABC transporter ATP-binding protein [Saccharicrinis fermentans]GAF04521.1 lipoprotein-releasing system ATP-binding protein LolD [Saccharicrinis fermentans DSM 9555 = JCM 21142]